MLIVTGVTIETIEKSMCNKAANVGITYLKTVLPHDQSHDIQISVKQISETAKKCHLAAETGSSSILNVCAKAILFFNT